MQQTIAILGSSRSAGNTRLVLDAVFGSRHGEVIDLLHWKLTPYDYTHGNSTDDFLGLARKLICAEEIVLATPVYWYSMSAQLKTFVDRLSDLITIRKDLGRALAGKRLHLVASSTAPELPHGFEAPFRLTCGYFAMRWGGAFHGRFESDGKPGPGVLERARTFGERILGPDHP